jgi:hypothetical protein
MGNMRNAFEFWLKNLKGRDHSEDLGVDGKITMDLREMEWGESGAVPHVVTGE